jgi:hypothetical protein
MAELNKTQLQSENQSSFPTNNQRQITAAILRDFNTDMIDSLVDEVSYNIDSASLSSSLYSLNNNFNTFTSSVNDLNSLTGSFATTGSNDFKGSQIITGSAYGNIVNLTIVSSTASVDLSVANFFSGSVASDTHFNIINPKVGQTAILKLTTIGAATASFSPNVLQPSGSEYTPSPDPNNNDILTIAAFDEQNVYVVSSNKFI